MGASSEPLYPFTVYNFQVLIGTTDVGGFSECTGLTSDTDTIEYRTGTDPFLSVRKLPGMRKFSNIVLKRGFTKDLYLWTWRQRVLEPKPDDKYRQDGQIILVGEDKKAALKWSFFDAYPSKLEGPAFNAKNNEIAIETLELVVERWQFEAVSG